MRYLETTRSGGAAEQSSDFGLPVKRRPESGPHGLAPLLLGLFLFGILVSTALGAEEDDLVAQADSIDRESLALLIERRQAEAALRPAIEALARQRGLPIRRELADGSFLVLKGFDGLRPIYDSNENLVAADSVSTDEVWSGGSLDLALDGAGEVLAIWDGASPQLDHPEIDGRVTHFDGAEISNHTSHVSCTMIASGVWPNARGMASAATLLSYDSVDDTLEMALEQMKVDPVKISNHSYGPPTGWSFGLFADGMYVWLGDLEVSTQEDVQFGFYHQTAADWDQLAYDSPYYLIVQSAGNDRNDEGPLPGEEHWHFDNAAGEFVLATDEHQDDFAEGGYDTINGGPKCAKNILTIGAIEDLEGGWTQPSDVEMTTFSNWGPTDDGRIKPDLVANGRFLQSCWTTSPGSYIGISGTSMAAPGVSGSSALLHQHSMSLFGSYFRAATMKALLLHTADEAGQPGPDYSFGWGLLNTAAAADVLSAHAETASHIEEETLENNESHELEIISVGGSPLAVTLVWSDPPGTPPSASAIDPPDRMLVNDLDLRIVGPSGTVHEPWVLDPANPATAATVGDNQVDSVEQVWIATPAPGRYTVRVSHEGTLVEPGASPGSESQTFSLVITGNISTRIFAGDFELGDLSRWSASLGAS